MMDGWGVTFGGWVWMGVWIAALVGMVWLIFNGSRGRGSREDALEILRARFARGEINQEEFEQARDALLASR